MSTDNPTAAPTVTAKVDVAARGFRLRFGVTLPAEPTSLRTMLPLVRAMSDAVVSSACASLAEEGSPVSCKAGCGACCRQLVPISEVEAHHIRDLVEAMPEPRRTEIRGRFAKIRERTEQAEGLEALHHPEAWTDDVYVRLGMAYRKLGMACPFLEDESCSIYHDRPITCREFLVTSPAENCANPTPETVKSVELPMRMVTTLGRLIPDAAGERLVMPVPLSLSLSWAEAHPAEPPPRPAVDWLRGMLERLRTIEGADASASS